MPIPPRMNADGSPRKLPFALWPAISLAHKPDAEKARQLLEERLRERPGERVSMRELIWVYLALKRDTDALKLARQAVDLLPPERDALLGNSNLAGLAEVEARTGAASDAIAILRRLLTIPAGETVSIARLKIDPVWDPIRNDPGFQQLLGWAGTCRAVTSDYAVQAILRR